MATARPEVPIPVPTQPELTEPRLSDPSTWRLLPFGILFMLIGFAISGLAAVITLISLLTRTAPHGFARALLLGGTAILFGLLLTVMDIGLLLPWKRQQRLVAFDRLQNHSLTVVLTALDDEQSIAQSVRDFRSHPLVRRVIVVDNNSQDRTRELAEDAGAIVVVEPLRGYGRCVYSALHAGISCEDTELTLLCEGDMTFRAFDIEKFMAYIPHADIVNGTRIVEQLRDRETQLSTFVFYGNFAMGKLLETKYLGQGTFTDVGTTYKLCRNSTLRRLLPKLNPSIGMEFNAHFLDRALRYRIATVECPVTFHKRVGLSKGGNTNNFRAFAVGLRMMKGILFSWKV